MDLQAIQDKVDGEKKWTGKIDGRKITMEKDGSISAFLDSFN